MNSHRIRIASIFLLVLCWAVHGQTPSTTPPFAEERIPIEFELRRGGTVELLSLQREGIVFLPVRAVFDFLKIKNEFNPVAATLSGFFVTPDTAYVLDLRGRFARVGKRSIVLSSDDFILSENEVYLRVEVFRDVFALPVEYKPRQLSAKLATRLPLPLFLDQRLRRMENEFATRPGKLAPEMSFARTLSFIDGFRLDYNLSSVVSTVRSPLRTFSFRGGAHVLGGDVEGRLGGRVSSEVDLDESRVRWRLVPPGVKVVRQILVGDFVTSAVSPREIYGLELTNRPPYRRIIFADQIFSGQALPDRHVYLYNNVRLSGVQTPSPRGEYAFETPLRYGSNLVDVRSFSEWGELYEESYRLQVPNSMIPPGEIDYNIAAGRLRENGHPWYSDIGAQWGVNSRLTLGSRMEFYDIDEFSTKVFPAVNAITRIGDNTIGEALLSPNALMQGSLGLLLPSLAGASISYTKYRDNLFFNPRNARNELSASAVLPVDLESARFTFDVTGQQTVFQPFRERNLRFNTSLYVGMFSPRLSTRAGWLHVYGDDTRLVSHETELSLRARLPANLVLGGSIRFDHLQTEFVDSRINAIVQPRHNLTIQVIYDRNFVIQSSFLRLRVQYTFPSARVSASATSTGQSVLYTQSVSGGIGLAPRTGDLFFDYNATRVGYGAIFVRPYLDLNNNGIMDSNEEIMRKAGLRASTGFEGAGASFLNFPNIGWGTIRALPYQEYFVEVDRRQFDNPLSIPRYSSFSVTAEPARFSFIDLPVISGGYVRGTVQLVTRAGQKTGLAGIKVRLRRSAAPGETIPTPFDKTTETFSTGEYEFSGLPPGEYEVSLDRIQLEMLDLSTDVLSREVTVEAKPEGDFIEGINFSLVERNNR